MKKRLETLLNNKTFYIVLSVLLAIGAWLLVLNYTNPIETAEIEVPIEFLHENAPAQLDLRDRTDSVNAVKTVKVTVSGRQDTLRNLRASEFRATVDMEEITKAGETEVAISRPSCDRLGISVTDYSPKSIKFTYDKITQKNLDVRVEYSDDLLKEDYEFIAVTSSLSSIPISGFASLLDTCDYVRVELSDSIQPGSLDGNRNAAFLVKYISVTGEDITHLFDPQTITVNIQVGKRVPFTYRITGTPDGDYYLNAHYASAPSVLLQGSNELLRSITAIDLGDISVEGAAGAVQRSFNPADFLPSGVTAYDLTQVNVTAEILQYRVRDFTVSTAAITTPGKNDAEFDYEITPESYTVQIRGRQDDMQRLTLASIVPTIDLTGKTVGVYHITLTFANLDASRYTLLGEYVFTVTISQKPAETEPPETESPSLPPEEATPEPSTSPTP